MSQQDFATHLAYMDIVRTQFATTLAPRDANARKVPGYGHRMLTMLLMEQRQLPALQQQAIKEYEGLLDELLGELQGIEGGMVMMPQLIRYIRLQPDYAQLEPFLQSAVRLLASKPGAKALSLQSRIAEVGYKLADAFHEAVKAQEHAPAQADAAPEPLSDAQKSAFRAYLQTRFPAEAALEIGSVTSILGGGSKVTLIVELRNAKSLPAELVVRLDRAEGVVDSTVVDEYRLIELVHGAGLKVPQPLVIETDKSVLGAPFIVVSKIEGSNIGDWVDVTEPSRAFAVGLAQTLAKLHAIAPEAAGDRLPGAKSSIRERVIKELAHYEASWRASGVASVAIEQANAWIQRHLDQAEGRRAIVHCDVGCHNMLAQDGELTALLDWETAVIGNPAQDLMYSWHTVTQMIDWDEYLAEYQRAGGILPSEAEMDFYRVLVCLFRIHFTLIARSFVASGMSSSMIHAYASQRVHLDADFQLRRAVKIALGREQGA